jgi:hypothetical protein
MLSCLLRLNFLAPEIKLAILQGSQLKTLNLKTLMEPFSDGWDEQRRGFFGGSARLRSVFYSSGIIDQFLQPRRRT